MQVRHLICGAVVVGGGVDCADAVVLAFFAEGPANGVPSRFSMPPLDLEVGRDSSRTGRTFKSAYFLQFVPHVSQRVLVGSPLGAFHHTFDSRVLQAPQLGVFEGWDTMDPSSSERPTRWPSLASAALIYCFLIGLGGTPAVLILWFSSPSLELFQ